MTADDDGNKDVHDDELKNEVSDELDDDVQDNDGTPPRHHVTFGPAAVVVGFLVGLSVLALVFSLPWAGDMAPGVFVLALAYGGLLGAVTALPLGVVLGFLLRPVRNQWVHVGVFFGVFTLVALLIVTLLSPSRVVLENLPIALIIGGAGAVARASVWKMVRVR
ncbi:hypothetical protein [Arthrobacter burdickii]|uniref:TIGR04086 family membrane protein n=1 Tax=Arthrobacter burdickii TaxID=3035920 RepID=A0ABT8JWZ7_9MICC|nr:hypothetical protein [Arthrobacter burdickii]MDN4609328.1 hypothetical protein [Arthrobacter burdickii]